MQTSEIPILRKLDSSVFLFLPCKTKVMIFTTNRWGWSKREGSPYSLKTVSFLWNLAHQLKLVLPALALTFFHQYLPPISPVFVEGGPCKKNKHCNWPNNICNDKGQCVGCRDSNDCPRFIGDRNNICSDNGQCVGCRDSNDCRGPRNPVCSDNGHCVQCKEAKDCNYPYGLPVRCNDNGQCVKP